MTDIRQTIKSAMYILAHDGACAEKGCLGVDCTYCCLNDELLTGKVGTCRVYPHAERVREAKKYLCSVGEINPEDLFEELL